jgi:2-aminoethylphosphonate-pyruvate transaminase
LALFLDESVQAPIILTFHAPAHPDYVFTVFYEAMRNRGFVLYPGKLTQIDTFRVGCIGAISPAQLEQAAHAIVDVLTELGWLPQKRLAATLDND